MITRRTTLALGLALGAPGALLAQAPYPNRPIRLIVPFPAGGGGDVVARSVGENLGKRLNQAVVIENKPGADQIIGTTALTQSSPDGYVLMMTGDTMLAHAAYDRKLPYDVFKDITPVGRIANVPVVLLVNPNLGVQTVAQLLALAKSKPGMLRAGHIGSGSTHYLAVKLMEQLAGVKFLDVPYKGSAQTTTALIGGEIDLVFAGVGAGQSLATGGKVIPLAVSTKKRTASAPNLPTLDEAGIPGFEMDTAFYIYAPGAIPKPIIARLEREIAAMVSESTMRSRLISLGFDPEPANHDESVLEHKRRYDVYRSVIKGLNLQWAE